MIRKINAILVDDEPGSLLTLETLIERYCPAIEVVATTDHPLDLKLLLKKHNPDLVFLDIEMPYANGFDLLDMLKPVYFEVIFVTAFNDYALKAFKYAALDYLLKPVNIDELKQAVMRVEKVLINTKRENERVVGLLKNLYRPVDDPQKISVPDGDSFNLLDIDEIVYLEASGKYSKLHFEKRHPLLIMKTLKDFEEVLPPKYFIRIHHSFLINLKHAKRYQMGRNGLLEMSNGERLEISSRKRIDFLARFKNLQ
jgi:two-component system LytT family response regulator